VTTPWQERRQHGAALVLSQIFYRHGNSMSRLASCHGLAADNPQNWGFEVGQNLGLCVKAQFREPGRTKFLVVGKKDSAVGAEK